MSQGERYCRCPTAVEAERRLAIAEARCAALEQENRTLRDTADIYRQQSELDAKRYEDAAARHTQCIQGHTKLRAKLEAAEASLAQRTSERDTAQRAAHVACEVIKEMEQQLAQFQAAHATVRELVTAWRERMARSVRGVAEGVYSQAGVDSQRGRRNALDECATELDAALAGGASGPSRIHHMKRGDGTVCGAAKARGNSYYEWAYVNCPECLATRPAPTTEEGARKRKAPPMPTDPKKPAKRTKREPSICMFCDGCGWCEGSPAFTCPKCGGTGQEKPDAD